MSSNYTKMPVNAQYRTIEREASHGRLYIEHLRISLIGNKDLKFKLIGDSQLIKELTQDFHDCIYSFISNENDYGSDEFKGRLQEIEHRLVIFKILTSFVTEIYTSRNQEIARSSQALNELIEPVVQFVEKYVEVLVPPIISLKIAEEQAHKLETMLEYSMDILVSLLINPSVSAKIADKQVEKLWKFIISILIITYNSDDISELLLVKLLNLLPALLNSLDSRSIPQQLVSSLLNASLKRLHKECSNLLVSNFPDLHLSQNELEKITYKDDTLPNLEFNPLLFKSNSSLKLMVSLINFVAQLLSVLQKLNYTVGLSLQNHNANGKSTTGLKFPLEVFLCLLLLIRFDNREMNIAALNLIYFRLTELQCELKKEKMKLEKAKDIVYLNYKKLIPVLVELLKISESTPPNQLRSPIFLLSPSRILAEMCESYPRFSDELRKANVDYFIMRSLELQFKSNQKSKLFKALKQNSQRCTVLVDFSVMMNHIKDTNINPLSDLLYLLSIFVSNKEEYRERIVNYKTSSKLKNTNFSLPQVVFDIIDDYRFLLLQAQLVFKILYPVSSTRKVAREDLPWFSKNLSIIISLLQDETFTNILYLIRSLSRSVALLRTFFIECNSIAAVVDLEKVESESLSARFTRDKISIQGGFVHNILKLLNDNEVTIKIYQTFCNLNKVPLTERLLAASQMLNQSILLGTLANFVLDFSSFRYNIVNDRHFLKNLVTIFTNAASFDGNCSEDEILQRSNTQLNVLRILKNYMYNENQENKKDLVEHFPISLFFEKIAYGIGDTDAVDSEVIRKVKLQQKLVSFDILRNLTAGSPFFSQTLIESYEKGFATSDTRENSVNQVPLSWSEFLVENVTRFDNFTSKEERPATKEAFYDDAFLLSTMNNNDYVSLILAINYIEDHKFTNIEQLKTDVLPKESMLTIWKRFLGLTLPKKFEDALDLNTKININNNLNSIKLSIVWILINLTWTKDIIELPIRNFVGNGHRGGQHSYRLFDTIDGPPRRSSSHNDTIEFGGSDDSEEDVRDSDSNDDAMSKTEGDGPMNDGISEDGGQHTISTASERAKLLRDYGFLEVLDMLVVDLSSLNKSHPRQNGYSKHRFDYFMSNDLLEKIKTARLQILEQGNLKRMERLSFRRRKSLSASVMLAPTSSPPRARRPDVNRGGEGFGYGSDEDYVDAPSSATMGGPSSSNSGISASADLQNNADEEEDEMEFDSNDEYWIH